MSLPRPISLALLALAATTWAGVLVVCGLWLLLNAPNRWPGVADQCRVGGISCLACGQFIFLVLVADRVYPRLARRNAVWWVELASVLVGLGGLVWVGWSMGASR